jgi:hypothetical protein
MFKGTDLESVHCHTITGCRLGGGGTDLWITYTMHYLHCIGPYRSPVFGSECSGRTTLGVSAQAEGTALWGYTDQMPSRDQLLFHLVIRNHPVLRNILSCNRAEWCPHFPSSVYCKNNLLVSIGERPEKCGHHPQKRPVQLGGPLCSL